MITLCYHAECLVLFYVMVNVNVLNVIVLNIAMLSKVMPNVIGLSVVMLSAVMLSVLGPTTMTHGLQADSPTQYKLNYA